ncbi:MAG: NAD-dependent epimerase/dehydratase family protein [Pseudomonadota bacterium]
MLTEQSALVTGATSQIGRFLLPRLQAAGFTVTAISRQSQASAGGIIWQQADLQSSPLPISQARFLFHLAPLPLLPPLLAHELPLRRVIAFSSTSCFTKKKSPDPQERAIAAQLRDAERALAAVCQAQNIVWTVLRPTLIYGCGIDKNVTFIAQLIRRFGFFLLAGRGTGLRQPVHADDLAAACATVCISPATANKAYNLSGGQTLSYRDMVEAIFQQLGKKPRIMSIPLPVLNCIMAWLPAMVMRMNQDLCFDHTPAYHDFGYSPRTFSDNDMGF